MFYLVQLETRTSQTPNLCFIDQPPGTAQAKLDNYDFNQNTTWISIMEF
jgi:hypothetical protein